jgi:hypothetical protein
MVCAQIGTPSNKPLFLKGLPYLGHSFPPQFQAWVSPLLDADQLIAAASAAGSRPGSPDRNGALLWRSAGDLSPPPGGTGSRPSSRASLQLIPTDPIRGSGGFPAGPTVGSGRPSAAKSSKAAKSPDVLGRPISPGRPTGTADTADGCATSRAGVTDEMLPRLPCSAADLGAALGLASAAGSLVHLALNG